MKKKISAVVVVYNEEKNIAECLKTLEFADETIVIDGESSDLTEPIAREMGAVVFRRPNQPNNLLDVSKNYGLEKATGEWILIVDADERISPELSNEIREAIKTTNENLSAFRIPRENYVFGKLEKSGTRDYQVRLIRKGFASYKTPKLHQHINVRGNTGTLSNPMLHLSIPDIDAHLKKVFFYSTAQAEEIFSQPRSISNFYMAVLKPTKLFIRIYIWERRFLNGIRGFIFSINSAMVEFLTWTNIWQRGAESSTMIRNRLTYLIRKTVYFIAHNTGFIHLPYKPISISIEPTNHCNLKCVMCPTGQGKVEEKGLMDIDIYKKIIDEVKGYAFEVILNIGGESTIHKNFVEMIRIARSSGLWVNFSTNATLLTEELSTKIIEANPTEVVISFDAVDGREIYEEMRPGSDYDKTLQNILTFLRIKKARNKGYPGVIIQTIRRYEPGLTKDIPAGFKNLFKELPVNRFTVEWAHTWAGDFSSVASDRYREPPKKLYYPCTLLWRNMAVGWDGSVFPCCFDLERIMPLGSIKKRTLRSFWNSKETMSIRKKLVRKRYRDIPLCSGCGNLWYDSFQDDNGVSFPLKNIIKKIMRKTVV